MDGSTFSSVNSLISSSGYKEHNNVSNNKFDESLMNYKETDKLTIDMTRVVVSSLVSSTSSTVGISKGSASTSSCFGMTTSISGIGIDEIISHSQSVALTLCWPYILLFSLKFLLLLSPAFVFPLRFLFLFEVGLSSLLQLSFLFLFFFFLFS